ncbi:alpha/beta hydrolase [Microbacterium sp.]|uniref:alpha/beta hydrolase n=1 Tax=Microbacterium sp. TaxID=51671 RepID=UPI003F94AAFA
MTDVRGIDPELVAAVAGDERPDLADDLDRARVLMSSVGLPVAGAEALYGSRVDVTEHSIDLGDRAIEVRVYTPIGRDAPAPGLLMLHGGAFVGGDRGGEHARSLRYAAEAGCVVVSPEYRLAPEHPYPAAFDDALAALDWMSTGREHIDPGRLAIGGVSAGGALAAGSALRVRDEGTVRLRALLLLFPALDDRVESRSSLEFTDSPVWDAANTREMWSLYLRGASVDSYAAPARATALSGLPPTYVLTAECDPLRDEGVEFARRLIAADVSADLRVWSGAFHVFDQLAPESALAKASVGDQVQFIRRYLH